MDQLIIMDDVSGGAEISKKISNFWTVSRKFGYNYVYVFMLLIPQVKFGKKLFLKTTFSIFFQQVFHITLL